MRFTLLNARLIDATTDISHGAITIEDTHIQAVEYLDYSDPQRALIIDASGMIVIPGFIDVHTHGGGGYSLQTTDAEEIRAYARWIPKTGTTSFLIVIVGVPGSIPERQLKTAIEVLDDQGSGAEPIGIHMEGPYINVTKRGAHLPSWLRMPEESETEQLLQITNGHLRLLTLAPELPGASAMIRRLVHEGIAVSMGHTNATYEQSLEAIKLGITHVTHCLNAMPPMLHRAPGPLAAVVQTNQVRGELIVDGMHVHPAIMNVLVKLLGPDRIVVVTDALSGAGAAESTFDFAGQPVKVIDGAARLTDGTLAGSVLTMDQALRNMLELTEATLQQAVGMLTLNPAQAAQVSHRKGCLKAGYDADILILDQSLEVQATFCKGDVAFATDEWKEKFSALFTF